MAKLQLAYPVTPVHVNQGWGVNGSYYQTNGINIKGHNGLDLQAYHGQPVYAAHDGTAYYEIDDSAGHGIVIVSDQPYDYGDGEAHFKTIYWHLADPVKEPKYDFPLYAHGANSGVGTPVKAGDQIGWADSTGLSTGDHLHFGLKPVRSGKAPTSGDGPDVGIGDWVNVEGDNGYSGAIDPTPYLLDGQTLATAKGMLASVAEIANEVAKLPQDRQQTILPKLSQLVENLASYLHSKGIL